METLLLARHAFAASNRDVTASCAVPGDGLTEDGVDEARRLGVVLEDEELDLAVATELRRAQETLELALAGRELPRLVVPELNEIDFGGFDGGSLEAYRAWAAGHPPALRAPGGGESRADAAARYARGLRRLLARPEKRILVVAHALAIRYALDASQGLVPAPLMAPIDHAVPHRLSADGAAAAAALPEAWSRAPRFRGT